MGRANLIQNNFTGGQVSPRFYMLVGNDRYKNGAKVIKNLKVFPQGGVFSRGGAEYISNVGQSTSGSFNRLIPFIFSEEDTYVILFDRNKLRFFKNGEPVLNGDTVSITDISSSTIPVLTYTGTDPSNGDIFLVSDVVGVEGINSYRTVYDVAAVNTGSNTFRISNVGNTLISSPDTSALTAYQSGGTCSFVIIVDNPYWEQSIVTSKASEVDYTQSGDVIILTHGDYVVKSLSRTGTSPDVFEFDDVEFTDGPYLEINTTATTLTPSGGSYAPGNSPTITASSVTGINNGQGFLTTDIGRMVRINNGTDWAWGVITGRTSTTVVTVEVKGTKDFPSTSKTEWRLGSWSETTGYPSKICLHDQRLFFGGNSFEPDKIWASAVGDYYNMTPAATADAAISFTAASGTIDRIQFMESSSGLRVGTSGGIYNVTFDVGDTVTVPKVSKEVSFNSASVKPLTVDKATLYVQGSKKKLRELVYNYEVDGLVAPDLTIISSNISGSGFRQLVFQAEPDSIVWGCTEDQELKGMTYLRSDGVVCWHDHSIGGFTEVWSVCSVPENNVDRLYALVQHPDNLTSILVRFDEGFFDDDESTTEDSKFLDAYTYQEGEEVNESFEITSTSGTGVTFTSNTGSFTSADIGRYIRHSYTDDDGNSQVAKAYITDVASSTSITIDIVKNFPETDLTRSLYELSVDTISDLTFFAGETLTVLVDGGVYGEVEIPANGVVELDTQGTRFCIGYPYVQELEGLDLEGSSVLGSVQGSLGKISELIVRFYKTVGAKLGRDRSNMTQIEFRKTSDQMQEGVPLFTGDKVVVIPHGYKRGMKVTARQEQPLPMCMLGYVAKVISSD